jgi:hypothetical protein
VECLGYLRDLAGRRATTERKAAHGDEVSRIKRHPLTRL